MRPGQEIVMEIGREADAKFPNDTEKAMEWARVRAKKEFGVSQETHPWLLELTLPHIRHAIHIARAHANRVIRREFSESIAKPTTEAIKAVQSPAVRLTTLPPERPKARQPERRPSVVAAAIVGSLARRIDGRQLGALMIGELPGIVQSRVAQACGWLTTAYVLDRIAKSGRGSVDQRVADVFTVEEVDGWFAEAEGKLGRESGELEKLIA